MNLRAIFENRSGRVIALFRAVLAAVFFVALLIEPIGPGVTLTLGQQLLAAYLIISLGAIVVAWRSWWFDQQFAPALLVLDVLVFVVAVYVTESANADFTSPFLAMFALAILSATLRWDWRVAALTGIAATVLFVVVGGLVWTTGLPVDLYRFGRRTLYMLALLLVLVWFGVQRRDPHVPALDLLGDEGPEQSRWHALDFAMAITGARRGVLAWNAAEEPWIELHEVGSSGRSHVRLGPEAAAGWDENLDEVRLFDLPRARKLIRHTDSLPRARELRTPLALARLRGIETGLALPVRCVSGSALIVLGDLPGAGADFVTLGAILAREIGSAFDRGAVLEFEREVLLSRTRGAIARDLHDSVAQSLAGACFRLEALRRAVAPELPAATEILAIRDALRREQGHVRKLIDALRSPVAPPELRDLVSDLGTTGADAAAHWDVAVAVSAPGRIAVSGWISHELQQLLREAVANAARHGQARQVKVNVSQADGRLDLDITDDGNGFDIAAETRHPWSIRERVAMLGGQLEVDSGTAGTRLSINLPIAQPITRPGALP